MLKRVHIKGYKSLVDVELRLEPLTVLIGANASGKSNFLDALQLLAGLATSRTVKQAFDPPYRGKPLESFNIGKDRIKGLLDQDRLTFSIEADLRISDAVPSIGRSGRCGAGLRNPVPRTRASESRESARETCATASRWRCCPGRAFCGSPTSTLPH